MLSRTRISIQQIEFKRTFKSNQVRASSISLSNAILKARPSHQRLLIDFKRHHDRFINSNTCSTAYPSGSAKHPTRIIIPSISKLDHDTKSQSIPYQHRQLPDLPNKRPVQIIIFLVIGVVWITFIQFSTNSEKFNSSVIKEILFELRNNIEIKKFLGQDDIQLDDYIKPLRDAYFSQVWVDGNINLMQGSVDVAFRVTGSQHSGKVYFTSVRRDRESEFEIIRWKLIRDDGEVIDLLKGKSGSKILKVKEGDSIKIRSVINNSNTEVDNDHESDLIKSYESHQTNVAQDTCAVRLV